MSTNGVLALLSSRHAAASTMPADEQPPRDDEHWAALLAWLRDAHGMDVGRSGLQVERRDAEGAAHFSAPRRVPHTSSQVRAKAFLPSMRVRCVKSTSKVKDADVL